jgi:hypothetical protein
MQHQDDDDVDDPHQKDLCKAQYYKCNDCDKVLSNMANLELHANKTGHSNFEESTEAVKPLTEEGKPLTEEEKTARVLVIKHLLIKKRPHSHTGRD